METQGILGAAAGCGVIVGPVVAMLLVSSQTEAAIVASVVQACVLAVLLLVPFESGTTTTVNSVNDSSSSVVRPTEQSRPSQEHDGPPPRDACARVPLTGVLALGGLTDAALDVWDELRHATAGEVVLVTARFIISLGYHVFLTGFYDMLGHRGLLTSPRAWSM